MEDLLLVGQEHLLHLLLQLLPALVAMLRLLLETLGAAEQSAVTGCWRVQVCADTCACVCASPVCGPALFTLTLSFT